MTRPLPDLSEPVWTSTLAQHLLRAGMAIARLDERISVSFVTKPWQLRASWTGYAAALAAQGEEVEEIDIFAQECGVPVPGRAPIETHRRPFDSLPIWQARFAENGRQHWTDTLPFSFDPPVDWGERPALLRALELLGRWARIDRSAAPWLELPLLLQRLGVTKAPLPCLVAGDKALRIAPRDREAIVMRYLRALTAAAEDGLAQLMAMERDRQRAAAALAAEHRPGKLAQLCPLLMAQPVLSPKAVSARLTLQIAGAGKLLERAAQLGLCVEVSGRQNWRLYLAPDLAVRFGYKAPPRGRPPSPAPSSSLDDVLAAFDAEMAAFDRSVGQHSADDLTQDESGL